MSIVQIVVVALIGAVLALLMRQVHPEYSIYMVFATGLLLLFLCLAGLGEMMGFIREVGNHLGENAVYLKILCKLVGIAYISEFASDLCKDAGYQTLSAQVEMAGKLSILVCAVPILESLMKIIEEVVQTDGM